MAELGNSMGTITLDLVRRAPGSPQPADAVATLDIPLCVTETHATELGVAATVRPDLAVLERLKAFLESENA